MFPIVVSFDMAMRSPERQVRHYVGMARGTTGRTYSIGSSPVDRSLQVPQEDIAHPSTKVLHQGMLHNGIRMVVETHFRCGGGRRKADSAEHGKHEFGVDHHVRRSGEFKKQGATVERVSLGRAEGEGV